MDKIFLVINILVGVLDVVLSAVFAKLMNLSQAYLRIIFFVSTFLKIVGMIYLYNQKRNTSVKLKEITLNQTKDHMNYVVFDRNFTSIIHYSIDNLLKNRPETPLEFFFELQNQVVGYTSSRDLEYAFSQKDHFFIFTMDDRVFLINAHKDSETITFVFNEASELIKYKDDDLLLMNLLNRLIKAYPQYMEIHHRNYSYCSTSFGPLAPNYLTELDCHRLSNDGFIYMARPMNYMEIMSEFKAQMDIKLLNQIVNRFELKSVHHAAENFDVIELLNGIYATHSASTRVAEEYEIYGHKAALEAVLEFFVINNGTIQVQHYPPSFVLECSCPDVTKLAIIDIRNCLLYHGYKYSVEAYAESFIIQICLNENSNIIGSFKTRDIALK